MKKISKLFLTTVTLLGTVSCGGMSSQNKEPNQIKLDKENVLEYIKMDISYDEEGKDILVNTKAASSTYTFSPYTGFYVYLYTDTIFDYEERSWSYKIYVSLNPDGTVEELDDNLNLNCMAMVFNRIEVYGGVDGYVNINGNPTNIDKGYEFTSNDEQQALYDSYVANIPKPGDETYGSEGNLYRYNDYSNKTGLALYSADPGDIICASRSFKHNNDKVTELGDGGPICEYWNKGEVSINNDQITSIQLSKYTEKINREALSYAKKLKTVELPSTLKVIDSYAFSYASLEDGIDLPDGLETIGDCAFQSTKMKTIFIPNSVQTIGKFPFKNCENLVIYCEATSRPSGWYAGWDVKQEKGSMYYRHTVIWGASRSDAK